MIKALAIKELRESAGLVAVAALGMAWAVARYMGTNPLRGFVGSTYSSVHLAFISDDFYTMGCLFIGGFAVLMGLKQSAWEVHHNTLHFLFHRPLARGKVLATKLVIGALLTFGLLAVSILVYGSWAATPGKLAAPFEWSMTADSWELAIMLPLIYLGGFLCGIRPGHWFGARLMPLVAAVTVVAFACVLPFWWMQLPLLVIGYACSIVAIGHYTHSRDY